jgi:hypothetical protein
MSFVAGFATGEVVENKRLTRRLREYIERHGISISDRDGQPVTIEALIADAFRWQVSRRWWFLAGLSLALILAAGAGLLLLI